MRFSRIYILNRLPKPFWGLRSDSPCPFHICLQTFAKENKAPNKQKHQAQDFFPHLPYIYFSEPKNTLKTEIYLRYIFSINKKKHEYRQDFLTTTSIIYFKLKFATKLFFIRNRISGHKLVFPKILYSGCLLYEFCLQQNLSKCLSLG